MEGKCFDCGRIVPHIHRHHPYPSAPETMLLCPVCHRRRHTCGKETIPWTDYLIPEQAEKLYALIDKENAELEASKHLFEKKLQKKLQARETKIEEKYRRKRLVLIKRLLPDTKSYTTINYPFPIWTLRFFNCLQPKGGES